MSNEDTGEGGGNKPGNRNAGNFANDRQRASQAGQKGGSRSNRSGTNAGNFANDRQRASQAGQKGGRS
jgi:uncharacterized protein